MAAVGELGCLPSHVCDSLRAAAENATEGVVPTPCGKSRCACHCFHGELKLTKMAMAIGK